MNTRAATSNESRLWLKYKTQFDAKTKTLIEATNLISAAGKFMETAVNELTGKTVVIVDTEQQARIKDLVHKMQILERQISGVILKRYFIKFDDSGEIGIFSDSADEGDIFPAVVSSSVSGFGVAPILIGVGIAAVTLLAGGFITLKILENQAKLESKSIMERMQKVDSSMMNLPQNKRKQWERWKSSAIEQVKAQARNIPGAAGLLSKFLGSKGTSIALAGGLAIAAAYFLIPQLRRN